jgi:hypothetical protein
VFSAKYLGSRVQDLGVVFGFRLKVEGLRFIFRVEVLRFRVQGLGFGVWGLGLSVWGRRLGLRV